MPHVGSMCKQGCMPARLPLQVVLPHGDISTSTEVTLAIQGGEGRNTLYTLRALKLTFLQLVIAAQYGSLVAQLNPQSPGPKAQSHCAGQGSGGSPFWKVPVWRFQEAS